MFKNAFFASATAGLIAAGTLAATTGTASAGYNGYNPQYGNNGIQLIHQVNPRRSCNPIFRQVRRWDQYGRPHWKRIQVGVDCDRVGQPQWYRQPQQYRPYRQPQWYRPYRPPQQYRPYRQHRPWRAYNQRNSGFSFSFGW